MPATLPGEFILISYTSYGLPFLYTAANWTSVSFYLEVFMRATAGTVYARLYDETANQEVTDSELSQTSSSHTRSRSSALSLITGHVYRLQFGKPSGSTGFFTGGKLVVF